MTAPPYTHDGFHPAFAALAERIVADRAAAWPAMIAAGTLDNVGADRRLFIMRAIAEIWRCATDPSLTPQKRYMAVSRTECLEELARAVEAAERRLQRKPDDRGRQLQRDQLIAMRWWHGRYATKAYALNMLLMLRFDALQLQLGDGASNERTAA